MTSPEMLETEKKSSGFMSKAKTAVVTALLMALTGAIGYGAGRMQTRSQVSQAENSQQETIEALEGKVQAAEKAVEAAEARSKLNEVRFLLLQSVDELSARNFGTANTQLRLASERLDSVSVSKDAKKLDTLKKALSTEEVNFAVNPVEERRKLVDFANQIDTLLPE